MKKVMVLLGLFLLTSLFVNNAYATIDIVYKKGGREGEDGKAKYDVVITVDLWLISVVYCNGPGNEDCPDNRVVKGATPEQMQNINDAREFARNQIRNSVLVGQQNLPSGLTVKWNSVTNNPDNCGECEIKIWTTGEPEPFKEDYLK